MKIIVRPILDPQREIGLTHRRLVSAIAEELWRLFGGNDTLNWIEAEWHLQRIIAQARAEARETAAVRPALASPASPDRAMNRTPQPVRWQRSDARSSRFPHIGGGSRAGTHSVEGAANRKADAPQVAHAEMAHV